MIIYKITCKLNEKSYVGKTARSLEVRITEHLYNSRTRRNKSYIDNAIGKYNWKNFTVEVLEICQTLEQLNEREKFWIRELNCKKPNGYNLTDGGEGVSGRIMPPEHRAKISKSNSGQKRSDATRKKMSKTWKGHEVTDETKAKLSANSPLKRPVRCIETNEIFDSITAASKWTSVTVNAISMALHGKTKRSGGYHWEYIDGSDY